MAKVRALGLFLAAALIVGCGEVPKDSKKDVSKEPKKEAPKDSKKEAGKESTKNSAKTPAGDSAQSTPEKTFEAMSKAADAKDWKAVTAYMTPESHEQLAGGMLFMAGFMSTDPTLKPEIEKIFKKHGIEPPAKDEPPKNIPMDDIPKVLGKAIKDKPAFIADIVTLLEKSNQKAGKKPLDFSDSELIDLKIEGDTASGFMVIEKDGKEDKQPIEFKKIDGRWFIHMVPPKRPGAQPTLKLSP
jgi:hypothetical protein